MPIKSFLVTEMGKSSRIVAVFAAAGLLALGFSAGCALAQAGSAGGTIGKTNKSVSGGDEEAPSHSGKSRATKRIISETTREIRTTGSADGTWAVSATASCVPAWTLTVLVSNGVISGSGASGQVSRAGAVNGNATVLGFRFDFIGHFRGKQASGTFVGPNNCPGQWTGTKS